VGPGPGLSARLAASPLLLRPGPGWPQACFSYA